MAHLAVRLCFAVLILLPLASRAATPAAQVAALTDFYDATGGPSGAWGQCNEGWQTPTTLPACRWFGILCDESDNIQGITLAECGLIGSIPESINQLPNLQLLVLTLNRIGGTLPSLSGSNLLTIGLYGNAFTGTLPDSWSTAPLQSVDIQFNNLTGSLPESWGSSTSLNNVMLAYNQLSGTIPFSWKPLVFGGGLNVSHNQLTGNVPAWNFTGTTWRQTLSFDASFNLLTGELPIFSNLQAEVTALALGNNQLSGTIPQTWRQFYFSGNGVRILDLSYNQLVGELGGWESDYGTLLLQNNRLTGNLSHMNFDQNMDLSNNLISGTLPEYLMMMMKNKKVDDKKKKQQMKAGNNCYGFVNLDFNAISGTIPSSYCNSWSGVAMSLTNNCITNPNACTGKTLSCALTTLPQKSTC